MYIYLHVYTYISIYIYTYCVHTHTYKENMGLNHKQIDENQRAIDLNHRKKKQKHGEPIRTWTNHENHGTTTKTVALSVKTIEPPMKNMAKSIKTVEQSMKTMEK